jgi:hypothetical protein
VRRTILAVGLALSLLSLPALAEDKPADNMQIVRDKLKADKKLLVAANMDLTESEAKGFWPIYDDYQKDLHKVNEQIGTLLKSYAKDYNDKSMTDDKAKKLIDESLAIDQEELKLRSSYVPRLSKVLPATKVARYLQIENKIRAIIRYDLASVVPLVP